MTTTLSSREFNQDPSCARKVAQKGPVFITEDGLPAHVLMSIEEYQRLIKQQRNIADALAMPGVGEVEFGPPKLNMEIQPANLS